MCRIIETEAHDDIEDKGSHFERLNILLEGFNQATGILDLEGNMLFKSGWREICTYFHRVNKDTARNCIINNIFCYINIYQNLEANYYN